MIPFLALALLAAGIAMIAFGLRGRIVERGVFCRKCRFDLRGLELDAEDAQCPECGRAVGASQDRRSLLRRRSRPMLIAGLTIVLLYAGAAVYFTQANTAALFAKLPDRLVVLGARMGDDGALSELVFRMGPPATLSDTHLRDAIELALEIQADPDRPWQLDWGEILANALQGDMLSDQQLRAFIANGRGVDAYFRDRTHHGDGRIGYWMGFSYDRMAARSRIDTGYRLNTQCVLVAIDGVELANALGVGSSTRPFVLPGPARWSSGGAGGVLPLPPTVWDELEAGDTLRLTIELRTRLTDRNRTQVADIDPIRYEHEVRVLAPGEPTVGVVEDADAAARIIEGVEVGPAVTLALHASEAELNRMDVRLAIGIYFSDLPRAIAGTGSLRVDGEEIEIGSLSMPASKAASMSHGAVISLRGSGDELSDQAAQVRRIQGADRVDFIFRTDPTKAETNPRIDEVARVDFIVPGLLVRIDNTREELYRMPGIAELQQARPLEEHTGAAQP